MYAPLRHSLMQPLRQTLALCLLLTACLLGAISLPVLAQSPPSPPTNLTAQARYNDPNAPYPLSGHEYVNLRWGAPQPAPSTYYYYVVERKTGTGGMWASVGTSDSPFLFYSDTDLPASTQFVYRVRLIEYWINGPSISSGSSNEAPITTLAAPPPAPPAPTGLAATPGDQQVTLTWTGSAQASYYLISVYAPEDDGSNAHVYVPAPAGTAVTFTVTGLANGVGYGFSVAAATWINTTESGTSYSADSNAVGATPIGPSFRVAAGESAPYYDASGNVWAADYFSSGGMAAWTNTPVTGTSDPLLYQTETVGSSFSYNLPLLNGTYSLNLLFAETQGKTKGQCLFNVSANGKALLTGFDIYAAAGGANKAVVETFPVSVTNGHLSLTFTATTGQASVAAISVMKPGPALDIPPPGWAEDVMPTDDASDADGQGPAAASSVNLASGAEENSPGPDLWAYNPLGPGASYERRYRSARAQKGYASPGLSLGWTDGYDLSVAPTPWGYILTYDNGGQEQWTGTTGSLGTPAGAPYLVNASGNTLTMTFKDRSQYVFTQVGAAGGNYPANTYLLTGITNLVGHAITLNRDTAANGYRLLNIANDAAPATALLVFAYNGSGKLSTVSDAYGRQITYGFTGGLLSGVSQIAAGAGSSAWRWQYGYTPIQGVPLLSSVMAPDPSNPGSMAAATTTYDPNTGTVSQHQDVAGRVHSYGYGGSQTVVQVNNADGSLAESWTQKQNAGGAGKNADTGTTDAAGKSGSVSYAGSPSPYLPSAATNRNGQTAQVTYDTSNPYANVLTAQSPRGVVLTTTYQYPADFPLGQVLSVMQSHPNAGGPPDTKQPTSFTYYGSSDGVLNGLLKTVTSPRPDTTTANANTVTTTYTYDSLGNVTQTTGPNANGTMTATYAYASPEAVGEPASVTVTGPDASGATTSTVSYSRYDARGNRTASIDALGNETDYYYTLADQLQAVVLPSTTGNPTQRAFTYTTYQYPGGPQAGVQVFAEGAVTSFPALGSAFPAPTASAFRQTGNVYDADGELTTVNGNTYPVSYAYDGRGRVKSVTYYQSSLMDSHTTFYDYDVVGNLAAVRYPGQSGATFDQTHYTYDADQNLLTKTDGRGVVTTYTRADPESLVTRMSYGGVNNGPLPSGVTPLGPVSFTYDHWGRRVGLTDDAATKTFAYDDLDELLSLTTSFGYDSYDGYGPQNQQIVYAHYPDGSRQSLSLPGTNYGNTQAYEYDGVGRLSATYLPGGPVYGSRYTYLPNGWLSRVQATYAYSTWGYDAPYLQVDRAYNPRGLMTSLSNSQVSSANVLSTLSAFSAMSYDADANRLAETATIPARGQAPSLSRSVQYGYDALDQLISETSSGSTAATNYTNAWAYDLAGNPTTTRNAGGLSFNADNQNTASAYGGSGDPLGLFLFSQNYSYPAAFDPEDRLTSTYQGNFDAIYDGDGLRTRSGSAYYLYDGDRAVAEVDYTGMQVAFTLNGASGVELRYQNYDTRPDSPGTAYTFDPQGNAVQPVTLNLPSSPPFLKVRASSVFEAFGLGSTFDADTPDTLDPIGFGGQHGYYRDYTTGLYLLTHRYYDTGTGRFVTRDPIGYTGGINLYGFAGNNPVNESDPSGFDPNDTNGGVGHLLPNANSEYSDGYQQFTQGQVPEYGDNYHGMARVGGGGPSPLEALGNWFSRTFRFGGGRSPRTQRGMVMIGGRGGRGGGLPHSSVQNHILNTAGGRPEVAFAQAHRAADVVDSAGRIHQIGNMRSRGGYRPSARERAAIEDIRKQVGPNTTIIFHDKMGAGPSLINPDLQPGWKPVPRAQRNNP